MIILAQSEIAFGIIGIDEAPVPPKDDPNAKTRASDSFAVEISLMNLYNSLEFW